MTDKQYLEILEDWCAEIEETWRNAHEELVERMAEQEVDQWENSLLALKQEMNLAADDEIDEERLYEQATYLFDEFHRLFRQAGLRLEAERPQAVPIGEHRLPPLPYGYDALEPVISREIMRLHHQKHHQSYVDGLNKAEKEMQRAREKGDFQLIKHWEREAAFHGSGHYLHTIFWNVMSPTGGGKPTGALGTAIRSTFGDFEQFKKHFSEAAKNVEGVGWAILVWAPRAHRLEILTAEKHQHWTQWDTIPLLVLDVWEHAYYLQYKNERAKYVENWWKIVNWKEVENRFKKARELNWQPY